jgi:5,10-methylenetetrahydromethanopterin reductase
MLGGQDTLTVLALAGREVAAIELATAVVPMPLRSPFALAQQAITVQQAIGGRLSLGVGTSHKSITRELLGAEWPPPLPTARAYLREILEILSGSGPRRVSTPNEHETPVLLGAVNPAMIALAVELAAGVVTWAAGPATLGRVVGSAVANRDPGRPFRVVAALPVCVSDDPGAVRARVHARYGRTTTCRPTPACWTARACRG